MTFDIRDRTLVVEYRITTPMFIAGADQQKPEIRAASIKGALRFWWRALNWGRMVAREGDTSKALAALHKEESRLFGSAVGSEGKADSGCQSSFLLTVFTRNKVIYPPRWAEDHAYLLGQGLYHFRDKLLRFPLDHDHLLLRLLFKGQNPQQDMESVAKAALLFGMLGGLGSRARRGFGSLSIEKINLESGRSLSNVPVPPRTVEDFHKGITQLLTHLDGSEPPFSALSTQTRIDVSHRDKNPLAVLKEVGKEFQLQRSWGRNGWVGEYESEKNYEDDHDWATQVGDGKQPSQLPRRMVFGMPHNYFLSHEKQSVDVAPCIYQEGRSIPGRGRRGSPLFIHIHYFPDDSRPFAAVQSVLPSQFLPIGDKVQVSPKRRKAFFLNNTPVAWKEIGVYLNRFTHKKPIFGGEVK